MYSVNNKRNFGQKKKKGKTYISKDEHIPFIRG
jgi:hypothetical protein